MDPLTMFFLLLWALAAAYIIKYVVDIAAKLTLTTAVLLGIYLLIQHILNL